MIQQGEESLCFCWVQFTDLPLIFSPHSHIVKPHRAYSFSYLTLTRALAFCISLAKMGNLFFTRY